MRLPISPQQLKKRLVDDNLITPEKFDDALTEAERKNQNLIDVLVSRRVADYSYLQNVVASILGVELANLNSRPIKKDLVKMLPEEVARQRQAIVFDREADGTYSVALADPGDLETLAFFVQFLKGKVKPYLATPDDLNVGFAIYGEQSAQDFRRIIEEQIQLSLVRRAASPEEAAADLPIVAIVDTLLSYAIASRASDIHIEILEDATLIRYRIDGILYEIMNIPKAIHPAVVARIKLLAGLKIDEHLKPQDGRFRSKITNQTYDIRVSVLPTFYGEKVELRLLEASQKPLSLEELGMLPDTARIVSDNLQKSYGMILSCGPTGSGKTTTLYALMNILNRPTVNIVTVEDPIEYNMRYVNQTQVNPQAGISFADGLRSILRQDPNIIMVGEIRDSETADIAVQAALTGHLLLSSLHTNDAPTTIPRLFDLGVPRFLVASTVNLVIAQRLVRRICQTCVYSYKPDSEFEKTVREQLRLLNASGIDLNIPKVLYRGKGCSSCGGTGYRGRIGIFELLEMTEEVRRLVIDAGFTLDKLRALVRGSGMRTMFEDGMKKVELAITTIEEVFRVIRE